MLGENGFYLTQQAEEFIANLDPDKKIAVVSTVGKYRTGKSFFVNRVLLDTKEEVFTVGTTVVACTKVFFLIKIKNNKRTNL